MYFDAGAEEVVVIIVKGAEFEEAVAAEDENKEGDGPVAAKDDRVLEGESVPEAVGSFLCLHSEFGLINIIL